MKRVSVQQEAFPAPDDAGRAAAHPALPESGLRDAGGFPNKRRASDKSPGGIMTVGQLCSAVHELRAANSALHQRQQAMQRVVENQAKLISVLSTNMTQVQNFIMGGLQSKAAAGICASDSKSGPQGIEMEPSFAAAAATDSAQQMAAAAPAVAAVGNSGGGGDKGLNKADAADIIASEKALDAQHKDDSPVDDVVMSPESWGFSFKAAASPNVMTSLHLQQLLLQNQPRLFLMPGPDGNVHQQLVMPDGTLGERCLAGEDVTWRGGGGMSSGGGASLAAQQQQQQQQPQARYHTRRVSAMAAAAAAATKSGGAGDGSDDDCDDVNDDDDSSDLDGGEGPRLPRRSRRTPRFVSWRERQLQSAGVRRQSATPLRRTSSGGRVGVMQHPTLIASPTAGLHPKLRQLYSLGNAGDGGCVLPHSVLSAVAAAAAAEKQPSAAGLTSQQESVLDQLLAQMQPPGCGEAAAAGRTLLAGRPGSGGDRGCSSTDGDGGCGTLIRSISLILLKDILDTSDPTAGEPQGPRLSDLDDNAAGPAAAAGTAAAAAGGDDGHFSNTFNAFAAGFPSG